LPKTLKTREINLFPEKLRKMSKITKSLISNKMPESSNIANYMVSISQNCPVCPEYKNTHNLDLLKNTKNPEISGFFRKRHLN